jgi:hypothetical protein
MWKLYVYASFFASINTPLPRIDAFQMFGAAEFKAHGRGPNNSSQALIIMDVSKVKHSMIETECHAMVAAMLELLCGHSTRSWLTSFTPSRGFRSVVFSSPHAPLDGRRFAQIVTQNCKFISWNTT